MERISKTNSGSSSAKHMDFFKYHKSSIKNLVMASLLLSLLLYLSIGSATTAIISKAFSSNTDSVIGVKDELERALIRASMANENNNKTVIIAIVNRAYVEGNVTMLDLFLESFRVGENTEWLMKHLLVVAVDEIAFRRCESLGLHCYRVGTEGVNFGGEKLFMSREFVDMMWKRTQFLRDVIRRGYSFIFTDMDVMWLRDPFIRLSRDENIDVQISCDHFFGNQWSQSNLINTGFYFVRSNNKTLSMFDTWHSMRNDSSCEGMKEQDVLAHMMRTGVLDRLGVKMRFLDTVSFSGFCEDSRRFGMVTTVHANCCRTISAKVADLTAVLGDWMRLKALMRDWRKTGGSRNRTIGLRWSRHVACWDSWIGFNFTTNRVVS